MSKMGLVIDIKADDAIVNIKRQSSCGEKCNTCESKCSENYMNVIIKNEFNLEKGDLIELDIEPAKLVKYTFLLYTFPLMMFVIGMIIGYTFYATIEIINREITAVVLGFGLLSLAYLLINTKF